MRLRIVVMDVHTPHMLGQVTVHSFLSISGIGKRYLLDRDVLITDVVFGLKRPPRIFA